MASNLGSVFVELSLNDQVYKQKLSETLTSTETTAKGIETSWKALGTKSDAYFEASKNAAVNAYTLIKNSATSTAQDIIRAEEAKNAKIQSLNDQQYGSHVSWIDTLKKNWLGMTAVATATFYAVKNIVAEPIAAYMESEQALLKMGMAMKNQGDFSRAALADLEEFAKGVQKTTAFEGDMTLALMATLKSFGMTNEEVKRSTQAAADMAAFTGKSIETVSELLGKAYAGNTAALSRYGIVVDENIPKSEKFAAVMAQLEQRFGGSAQAELLTYAGQWKQIKNQWQDIQEFLGLVFLKTIQGLLFAAGLLATTFMTAGNLILGVIRIIQTPFNLLLQGFAKLADLAGLTGTAEVLRGIATATEEAQRSVQSAREGVIAWTSKQYDAMTATAGVTGAIEKMGQAGERTQYINDEAAKAAKKNADEQQKREDDLYLHEMALLEARDKEETEYFADLEKKRLKDAADAEKKASDKAQYERDIYEDLRGYAGEYYDATLIMIESQAKKYREAGVDEVAVAAWVAKEQEKAWVRMAIKSDDFFAGVKAGILEMKTQMVTWGKVGYKMFETFSNDSSKVMSDILFDGIKGDIDSLSKYFKSFFNSLLRTFTDLCGKMLVQWALVKSGLANVSIGGATIGTAAGIATTAATTTAANAAGSAATAGGFSLLGAGGTGGQMIDYAAGVADYLFGSAGGNAVLTGAEFLSTAAPWVAGAFAVDQLLFGGAVTDFVGDVIGGIGDFLGLGSNAGFGSKAGNVDSRGAYGGLPDYGSWAEMSGAKGAAPSDLINSFMSNANAAIAYTYGKISDYANTLDEAHKTALAQGLASMEIKYLPQLEGLTTGTPTDDSVTGLFLTRESASLAENYIKSIPSYILSQVNPVVEYLTGNTIHNNFPTSAHSRGENIRREEEERVRTASGRSNPSYDKFPTSAHKIVSARSGLDYVPHDNFLINAHRGERVQTADERSNLSREIRELRNEQRATSYKMVKLLNAYTKIIKDWDGRGLPATRT